MREEEYSNKENLCKKSKLVYHTALLLVNSH